MRTPETLYFQHGFVSFKKSGDVIEWRYWKYNDVGTHCSLLEIGKFSTDEEYAQFKTEIQSLGSVIPKSENVK